MGIDGKMVNDDEWRDGITGCCGYHTLLTLSPCPLPPADQGPQALGGRHPIHQGTPTGETWAITMVTTARNALSVTDEQQPQTPTLDHPSHLHCSLLTLHNTHTATHTATHPLPPLTTLPTSLPFSPLPPGPSPGSRGGLWRHAHGRRTRPNHRHGGQSMHPEPHCTVTATVTIPFTATVSPQPPPHHRRRHRYHPPLPTPPH